MKRFVSLASLCMGILLASESSVRADVIIYSGYHDGTGSGGTPVPPNPWFGSANTTFFGTAGDISAAQASDPDISAIRIVNTGGSSVSLSALSLTKFDVLARDSVSSPLTLLPGQNYIFAVGDGSENGLSNQTISVTLNGTPFSFGDASNSQSPSGILFGNTPFVNGVESQPWTQDADLLGAVPEPGSITLLAIGLAGMAGRYGWRRRTAMSRS